MESLREQMNVALEEERRQQEAALEEHKKQTQARMDQLREQQAHRPRETETAATDIQFTPEGRPVVENIRFIHKWDDGYGNVVYTANTRSEITGGRIVGPAHIQPLSTKIQAQQGSFRTLEVDEQSRIRGEFDSLGDNASSAKPYGDYLKNEVLGKKFEELKANPPRPSFGVK